MKTLGVAAGAAATGGVIRTLARPSAGELKSLAERVLSCAWALGCSYADVHLDLVRDRVTGGVTERCCVRVVHAGGWAVALGSSFGGADLARAAPRALASARRHAALGTDPFASELASGQVGGSDSPSEQTYFASSNGTRSWTSRRFE